MPQLPPALLDLVVRLEDPVHRADRADVLALIEERGVHLGRRHRVAGENLIVTVEDILCAKEHFALHLGPQCNGL